MAGNYDGPGPDNGNGVYGGSKSGHEAYGGYRRSQSGDGAYGSRQSGNRPRSGAGGYGSRQSGNRVQPGTGGYGSRQSGNRVQPGTGGYRDRQSGIGGSGSPQPGTGTYGGSQSGNGGYGRSGNGYDPGGGRNKRNHGGRSGKGEPEKRKKRTFGDAVRFLLMVAALAVFCYSGYMLYTFYREYKKGSDEYDNLEANYSVSQDESENMDALEDDKLLGQLQGEEDKAQTIQGREMVTVTENGKEVALPVMNNPIDFTELKEINQDICGWLRIRAIDISYPLVQGEDNDYYLHRTFEGESNFAGCLFLNYTNRPDFTDQNTIIYGHNMKNGSMFGKLKQFQEEETFKKSKYFWIFTPDFIYQYRIFSAMVVNKVGLTYQTLFLEDEFRNFVDIAFSNSQVDHTGVEVKEDDRVVTLSTCTGDDETRFVVIGKLAQVYVPKDRVNE